MSYLDWVFKLDPVRDQLRAGGYWRQAKPRFTVFLPVAHAAKFAGTVLAELSPDALGAGGVRFTPIPAAAIKQPMFTRDSDMSTEDWQRHDGDHWSVACELKAQFDPDHVLTPGQRIFSWSGPDHTSDGTDV